MGAAIRTRIVKIGNSQGVRIPEILLEQSGIHAAGYGLTIRTASPRTGWKEAFAAMAKQQDDVLHNEVTTTDWDRVEWEW